MTDLDRLGTAFGHLSDDLRHTLELAVRGLGYREIARRLGESDEVVRTRLRLGLAELRALTGDHGFVV